VLFQRKGFVTPNQTREREMTMQYELTITLRLDSDSTQDRLAKQVDSLFEYGTIKESIVDGLQLLEDPRLVDISVRGNGRAAWC